MKLGIIPVSSSIHGEEKEEILREVEKTSEKLEEFGVETILPSDYADNVGDATNILNHLQTEGADAIAVFIVTGGTENMIVESMEEVSLPIFLFGDSKNNSFAATFEAFPKLSSMGKQGKAIFREDLDEKQVRKIKRDVKVYRTIQELKQIRLGLIGNQSPWLVSSTGDFQLIEEKIGPRIVQVGLPELLEGIDGASSQKAQEIAEELLSESSEVVEPSREDVIEAARIYLGMKEITEKHDLDAVTVGCFEIIPEFGNTGCLALSKLIDEEIMAGCEGEMDTTMTMIILNLLSDRPVWMANTVSADTSEDVLTFAHCTISTKMLDETPKLRSHFESGEGVAIQGTLEEGEEITLARLGGPEMESMLIASGVIKKSNLGREDMCRTQIKVELKGGAEKYVNNPLGNHIAIVKGDLSSELEDLAGELGIGVIKV